MYKDFIILHWKKKVFRQIFQEKKTDNLHLTDDNSV